MREEMTDKQTASMGSDTPELTGNWSVYRTTANGERVLIEGDLPKEIARQMVADYAAEGETTLEAVEE
ncbi:MAG: hypothetical protein KDA93_00965 [Planctomycetaceae bacterium]|nr:hypothetical protein [Planctomycetaceae bacterium]